MMRVAILTATAITCLLPGVGALSRADDAGPGVGTDYGPFLTGSLDRDKTVSEKLSKESTEQAGPHPNALAAKAVNVRLAGGDGVGAVAFDTDLLRYAAGWTGGFLDLGKTHLTTPKGSTALTPAGRIAFTTPPEPGWYAGDASGDPRQRPFGPLPREHGRYRGLYVHGDRVVFHYTVGGTDVYDMPTFFTQEVDGKKYLLFGRSVHVTPHRRPLTMLVCADSRDADRSVSVSLVGEKEGLSLLRERGRTYVRIAPTDGRRLFMVSATGPVKNGEPAGVHVQDLVDPVSFIKGGPARHGEPVVTAGSLGAGDGAYVVDTLTLPDANPWDAWVRPSGLDFFSDGRLAVCTLNGDVWVVSGVDEKLGKLTWRRFAAGLYEPLGLKVVGERVHVLGRDQITRLHDLNGDGAADFYENFNNDAPASANYHGFAMDLGADGNGNFYYTRAGQRMHPDLPMHGAMLRVSADGSKAEPIASGLRAANGLGVGPGDLITAADNQGNWTPSSRINMIRPGGFYGYMPHVSAARGSPRTDHDPPLCWIPITVDNSSGSQVWSDPTRFGPLSGRMFHTSYGKASLMLVATQKLDDTLYQGGVIKMPFRFDSGVMRGRVSPKDGQLYLCGLRGWQTDGSRDGTLVRLRHTGKPLHMPTNFRVVPAGIELTFSQPLDPETAQDAGSYAVQQWNYLWGEQYGSPEFSVKHPTKQGRDEVTVESARLLPDRKTVLLSIPDIRPVMQMQIDVDVDAADGKNIRDTLYLTINGVPGQGQDSPQRHGHAEAAPARQSR